MPWRSSRPLGGGPAANVSHILCTCTIHKYVFIYKVHCVCIYIYVYTYIHRYVTHVFCFFRGWGLVRVGGVAAVGSHRLGSL